MDAEMLAERAWEMRVSLMRVAMSIVHNNADAEDAVATALMNAYRRADSLKDEEKLQPWMMRIVANSCYDLLRKKKREIPSENLEHYAEEAVFVHAEGSVFETIGLLPEPYQRVMVLFYYEGFKAREIAQILSMPVSTVLVQLSRARGKLRKLMEKEVEQYEKQGV